MVIVVQLSRYTFNQVESSRSTSLQISFLPSRHQPRTTHTHKSKAINQFPPSRTDLTQSIYPHKKPKAEIRNHDILRSELLPHLLPLHHARLGLQISPQEIPPVLRGRRKYTILTSFPLLQAFKVGGEEGIDEREGDHQGMNTGACGKEEQ